MDKLFKLSLRGTDKKTEIIAGLTTFMTMAYVLAVQPAAICGGEAYITDVNGVVITKSAIMITCALVSGLITLLMAFYTNFPFALSTAVRSGRPSWCSSSATVVGSCDTGSTTRRRV